MRKISRPVLTVLQIEELKSEVKKWDRAIRSMLDELRDAASSDPLDMHRYSSADVQRHTKELKGRLDNLYDDLRKDESTNARCEAMTEYILSIQRMADEVSPFWQTATGQRRSMPEGLVPWLQVEPVDRRTPQKHVLEAAKREREATEREKEAANREREAAERQKAAAQRDREAADREKQIASREEALAKREARCASRERRASDRYSYGRRGC
jgi:hypothetical protein